ncbi:hypothetical protein V6N11_050909 [Hibiscus sabdariffa]|uniref:Reverse transcriptase zinc-binding domain-containing protein n=2 Tax=Hibiscus sabdariffa TaxID=183260 RepID=A0ABR2TB91_9ROSI
MTSSIHTIEAEKFLPSLASKWAGEFPERYTWVLSAKYFPCGNVFQARLGDKPSFAWRGIFNAMREISPVLFWRVGINSYLRMHGDAWGGIERIIFYTKYSDGVVNPIRCGNFMIPNEPYWNETLVRQVFMFGDANRILQCPIAHTREETILWTDHSSGVYSTKSAYLWLLKAGLSIPSTEGIWKMLAKLRTLPRIRVFAWRACHDALPTGNKLVSAGLGDDIVRIKS